MCLHTSSKPYQRHQPEHTNLYRVIAENYQTFRQERSLEGRDLPKFIADEFEGFLHCGIPAYGFGRLHCPTCDTERIVAFSCKGRGFCPSCGARRMAETAAFLVDQLLPLVPIRQFVVTFPVQLRLWLARSKALTAKVCQKVIAAITRHLQRQAGIEEGLSGSVAFVQRFGSAGNLHLHLHVVALDGVYDLKSTGRLKFTTAKAPREETITLLAQNIATRVNRLLIKEGFLEILDESESPTLANTDGSGQAGLLDLADDVLHLPAQAASVVHRIAFGPNAGKPVRRLRSAGRLWPSEGEANVTSRACVSVGGYSVHAETAIKAHQRERLEKLVRYMARPAIADERIQILDSGEIRLQLKTPWRDGTEALLLSPTEMIERLVALIPPPGFHMTRYFGVLASASKHRNELPDLPRTENDAEIQGKRGKDAKRGRGKRRMRWADLLKRTFKVDVLECPGCGGRFDLVMVVFDRPTIDATLMALGLPTRAPPIAPARQCGLFGSDCADPIPAFPTDTANDWEIN